MDERKLNRLEGKPEFKPAGFQKRFLAYLIDIIPIVIGAMLIANFLFGINLFSKDSEIVVIGNQVFTESSISRIIVRYVSFLIWIFYSIIMDSSRFQGTYGKQLMKIKVVDEWGEKIGPGKSIVRNFSKIVSYLPIGLGFVWVIFNQKKKGWHDMIAGTNVQEKDAQPS